MPNWGQGGGLGDWGNARKKTFFSFDVFPYCNKLTFTSKSMLSLGSPTLVRGSFAGGPPFAADCRQRSKIILASLEINTLIFCAKRLTRCKLKLKLLFY